MIRPPTVIMAAVIQSSLTPISVLHKRLTISPLTVDYVIVGLGLLANVVGIVVLILGLNQRWQTWKQLTLPLQYDRDLESGALSESRQKFEFA